MQYVSRVFPFLGKDTDKSSKTEVTVNKPTYNIVSSIVDTFKRGDILCVSKESLEGCTTSDLGWISSVKDRNHVIVVKGIPKIAVIKN